jgi:hypothetical protein
MADTYFLSIHILYNFWDFFLGLLILDYIFGIMFFNFILCIQFIIFLLFCYFCYSFVIFLSYSIAGNLITWIWSISTSYIQSAKQFCASKVQSLPLRKTSRGLRCRRMETITVWMKHDGRPVLKMSWKQANALAGKAAETPAVFPLISLYS